MTIIVIILKLIFLICATALFTYFLYQIDEAGDPPPIDRPRKE